jgi:hypothetical protein
VRVPEVPNAPILIVLAVVTAPFIVGWTDAVALPCVIDPPAMLFSPPAPLCLARQGSNYSARSGSFSVLPLGIVDVDIERPAVGPVDAAVDHHGVLQNNKTPGIPGGRGGGVGDRQARLLGGVALPYVLSGGGMPWHGFASVQIGGIRLVRDTSECYSAYSHPRQ